MKKVTRSAEIFTLLSTEVRIINIKKLLLLSFKQFDNTYCLLFFPVFILMWCSRNMYAHDFGARHDGLSSDESGSE